MEEIERGGVHGILHVPNGDARGAGIVLSHGASADCRSALLSAMGEQLAAAGYHVLRCDLAFRQARKHGPPHPSKAAADRESLVKAIEFLRTYPVKRIVLGGHSYGGRQATLLVAENAAVADSLLLFSYPLHPPGRPEQLRTAHFPNLKVAATFVHGTADAFGSPEEMRRELQLIPAPHKLFTIAGAGHDLKRGRFDLIALVGDIE